MPTLDIPKTYADGEDLFAADLDAISEAVETFVNTTKLDSANLQSGAVATDNIASSAVTTAKIASDAVTTPKIADSNVTTAKIADSNITTAKIADSNITTAKIADAAITMGKLSARAASATAVAGGLAISSSSGNFFTTVNDTDVTNLSVTLTTVGRPVMLMLIPDGTTSTCFVGSIVSSGGIASVTVKFLRSSSVIGQSLCVSAPAPGTASYDMRHPPSAFMYVDTGATAGTQTYKVKLSGLGTFYAQYAKLVAYEL